MKHSSWVLLLFIFQGCCSNSQFLNEDTNTSVRNIRSNLGYLASDELQGREAATPAEKTASKFIASELQKYGVKPFGDSGTYFQNFKVKLMNFSEHSTIVLHKKQDHVLKIGEDFARVQYIIPDMLPEAGNKEIIFAGYGITSPADNYDDYKNLDVRGKIVLVFSGFPSAVSDTENFVRSYAKLETAIANGASGFMVLPGDYAIKRWDMYRNRSTSKSFVYEGRTASEETIPAALLSEESSELLLNDEDYTYNQLAEYAAQKKILPVFSLKCKATFKISINSEEAYVRNVVGLIEGSDKSFNNEYLSIGAHYDHEGVVNGEVYNGANDNASGTSALLETARLIAGGKQNKRPVIVIFYTAEEKGLIGSKYFTANSPVIDSVIVNINMDMVGAGSSDTLYSVGSGRISRELFNIVNDVNESTTMFTFNYRFDAPDDPERIYYRSDHYQFAKRGIPAVFFTTEDTLHYHKPVDDAEYINFEKVAKVAFLVKNISLRIANMDHKLKRDAQSIHAEDQLNFVSPKERKKI